MTDKKTVDAVVREILPEETSLAYRAMFALRESRPTMATSEKFAAWVDGKARPEGYRLAASFVPAREDAVAVAGFRFLHTLAWGKLLYVDDLVTLPEFRSGGHGDLLMEWLVEEATRLGCEQLHLDSGHHRHGAHKFYLNHGMRIDCHHFSRVLGS